ncbi:MAG: hypothetical protein GYA24_16045 [Candidatus Lokiarchaeota archaeon]|nr:hypothetical protein [Candidatus Lokiarchaeota archaeon]
MGKNRKPKRQDDIKKARSYYARYLEHQEKVHDEPTSISIDHWMKEKETFIDKINFHINRAGVRKDDIIGT